MSLLWSLLIGLWEAISGRKQAAVQVEPLLDGFEGLADGYKELTEQLQRTILDLRTEIQRAYVFRKKLAKDFGTQLGALKSQVKRLTTEVDECNKHRAELQTLANENTAKIKEQSERIESLEVTRSSNGQ